MPGFATPRVICDVPFVGKRWVHMLKSYDRERGISCWTKNYRTGIEFDDPEALGREYVLRPDLHVARGRTGLVARGGCEWAARRALGRAARAVSQQRPTSRRRAWTYPRRSEPLGP